MFGIAGAEEEIEEVGGWVKVVCASCYLLGALTGIVFLNLPASNSNRWVRLHAWQSILFTGLAIARSAGLWLGLFLLISLIQNTRISNVDGGGPVVIGVFLLTSAGMILSSFFMFAWLALVLSAFQDVTRKAFWIGRKAAELSGF
jgi:uncharacterized membrane protein